MSYLATKKGSIACGMCASIEFVMCVIKTNSPSLPFSPGEPGFLVAAHLGITDPSLSLSVLKLVALFCIPAAISLVI